MKKLVFKLLFLFIACLSCMGTIWCQNKVSLYDARKEGGIFREINKLIETKPKEVLFGVDIDSHGDVYFSMSNKEWFDKIFSLADGVTADIVSKDIYDCSKATVPSGVPKGEVIQPLYKQDFKQNKLPVEGDFVYMKIGHLPVSMIGKELEANLVILNGRNICYYSNFINIERSALDVLPMGLYADELSQSYTSTDAGDSSWINYTKKIEVTVPFVKGKTTYNKSDLQPLYDSLALKNFNIKRISIRAYASVEGTEAANKTVMTNRATAMVKALEQIDPSSHQMHIAAAENWIEFYQDIKGTPYADLANLSKQEVRVRLMDKAVAAKLEPVLSKERKAIVTIYLNRKTGAEQIPGQGIVQEFKTAVTEKKLDRAKIIQKEILERIADHKLPDTYINDLKVPMEKDYFDLVNDREVYMLQFRLSFADEALAIFREMKLKDPANKKVNYNICALTIQQWQAGDTSNTNSLENDIKQLGTLGIDISLIKRLLINYNILLSQHLMEKRDYEGKDDAVAFIRGAYTGITLTDEDIYSLAKYFTYYAHGEWAFEIISPRVDKLNVTEDILFYYVNLGFYYPGIFKTEQYQQSLLNASTINAERFCKFFTPNDKGGASIQLLDNAVLRKYYCESCGIARKM